MQPVTLSTPKPLVKVNGIRMIDTVIDALHKNDIYEIYIVVGYLKEQFHVLTDKYGDVTIIENPYYADYNNISSLYMARNYLEDAIILDGDQIINNCKVLEPNLKNPDIMLCGQKKDRGMVNAGREWNGYFVFQRWR